MKRISFISTGMILGTVIVFSFISCKKDSASSGCSNNDTPGVKFTQVRAVITANCGGSGCHMNGGSAGGHNFDSNCSIVDNKSVIQDEIVTDGMPPAGPLTTAEKAIVNDWITAGGRITD